MSSTNSTIISIQYLRALAAGLVLLEHISKKSGQVGHEILSSLKFGYTGVDVFFVISGFIMCFIYVQSGHGIYSLVGFWKRRIARILPLYWVLSLLALFVFLLAPDKVNSSGGETVIWQSFFLIPGEGQRFLIANGWTLSYEMYFYAIFSLSFLTKNKLLGSIQTVLLLLVLASVTLYNSSFRYFLTNSIVLEFAFGIIVYRIYAMHSTQRISWPGVAFIILGGLLLISQQFLVPHLPGARFLTAGVPSAFLVLGFVMNEAVFRVAPQRLLQMLGDSSYSMYLFHPFPLKAAGLVFGYFGLAQYGSIFEGLYWIIIFSAVLALSYFVFIFIERPLISWSLGKVLSTKR